MEYNFSNKCPGPSDRGPCNLKIYKWSYDAKTESCSMFVWGGCAGNDKNRFDSEHQCIKSCIKPTEIIAANPVPIQQRGPQLTFLETGDQSTFMFAQSNTFIQIEGDIIQTFQLRLCRQISFQFRTRLPHGLLVYHNVNAPTEVPILPYALYIIVEQGRLKVVHVYGSNSTTQTIGQALNRDEWHSVTVRIDVNMGRLITIVDDLKVETKIKGLHGKHNYGVTENVTSGVFVGGLHPEETNVLPGVKYIIESFIGCIKDIVLSYGKSASELLPITPLVATKHENVQEGCVNKCKTKDNLCFEGSTCINHYRGITCDCFGTQYEGEFCDIYSTTALTLRGSSYVSYRVYDWKDRVHSAVNRFSMMFKTRFDDSVLFYAAGGNEDIDHYIAASIQNNFIHVEIDFGNGSIDTVLGRTANFADWNHLIIEHEYNKIHLMLNDEKVTLNITGNSMLHIDPEIYIGGGPELHKKRGLHSSNNFAGCIKHVFFNDFSIINELHKLNPKVHYIGILRPEFYETDVKVIPLTFPFASSYIWWPNDQNHLLHIKFDFKSSSNLSVLASTISMTTGIYWEIRLVNDEIRFELSHINNNSTYLISLKQAHDRIWHSVDLKYESEKLWIQVDNKYREETIKNVYFEIGDKIMIGGGSKIKTGLVGCMRNIEVNNIKVEPRSMLQSERMSGEVTLDDCRFVDPCKRPNTCEHGGKCSVKDDKLLCDCTGTGYIGKNCHFTKYRKTCEELALLGHTKDGVYVIDIDGNGRFPPVHVSCMFQTEQASTKTVVEHNLLSQMDVRSTKERDFSFNIKYREFSADMLQELISHSLNCSQQIQYGCLNAPLDLHTSTWFVSSANKTIDFIGEVKRGRCPCSIGKQCDNATQWCNCENSVDNKYLTDEGYFTKSEHLGITEMFFLQQPNLPNNALGRITLGPLECFETNTQKYVVMFTTSESYIEVPGWRKGDLALSFRTTGKKAILLYQPPIRPNYPSFMVALTNDRQLTFNFTLNTRVSKELVITSTKPLNGGEWHKLWIDYNTYHVRFMINEERAMYNLELEEQFGPFEGSMFIGGAPVFLHPKSSISQGLIGCFRGLVVNDEVLDIYSYMSVHLNEIKKECKPSCVPNPCKNGAQCKELWKTFECICPNTWAYKGVYCETNINKNAITFTHPESYLKKNYLGTDDLEEKSLLRQIFDNRVLINLRTYDITSLIMYANDHLNNFVHLYLENGTNVIYLFNYADTIYNITVENSELNSSQSIQIVIERNPENTTLHVNDRNNSIPIGVLLLKDYLNKPWKNPEKEVLSPQRPPAPPTDYFEINLGGYDEETLTKVSSYPSDLPGYVGCIRGLQIGEKLIDLPSKIKESDRGMGVKANCNLKCDNSPCKNGGICIEDFRNQEHTCDCELTSYYGELCLDEKGAEFSGESILWREYVLNGSVDYVKAQLAFSTADVRQKNTALLLLKTETSRRYYLLFALTAEGHLVIKEDRENYLYGAILEMDFINGARHSIYYKRQGDVSELLVDKEAVKMMKMEMPSFSKIPEIENNELQIGGHNTSDPRFTSYKYYSGCLSNVFVQINNNIMKPLEEYMFFIKVDENVSVSNPQGVRSTQCNSFFDADDTNRSTDMTYIQGQDKTWVRETPHRIPYESSYKVVKDEEGSEKMIIIILSVVLAVIVIGAYYEVYRSHKQYIRRKEMETDASIFWSKEQALKLQQPSIIITDDILDKPITNGNYKGNYITNEIPIITEKPVLDPNKINQEKRITFRDSGSELSWDLPENTELLSVCEEEEIGSSDEEDQVDRNKRVSKLHGFARLSSISEVTLSSNSSHSSLDT